jgi:hypothetical protein
MHPDKHIGSTQKKCAFIYGLFELLFRIERHYGYNIGVLKDNNPCCRDRKLNSSRYDRTKGNRHG